MKGYAGMSLECSELSLWDLVGIVTSQVPWIWASTVPALKPWMEGRSRVGLVVRETFLLVASSITSLQSTHPTVATWFFFKDANQTNPPCLKTSDGCSILSRWNLNTSTWPQGSLRSGFTHLPTLSSPVYPPPATGPLFCREHSWPMDTFLNFHI